MHNGGDEVLILNVHIIPCFANCIHKCAIVRSLYGLMELITLPKIFRICTCPADQGETERSIWHVISSLTRSVRCGWLSRSKIAFATSPLSSNSRKSPGYGTSLVYEFDLTTWDTAWFQICMKLLAASKAVSLCKFICIVEISQQC